MYMVYTTEKKEEGGILSLPGLFESSSSSFSMSVTHDIHWVVDDIRG